jgi:hypothetical protein
LLRPRTGAPRYKPLTDFWSAVAAAAVKATAATVETTHGAVEATYSAAVETAPAPVETTESTIAGPCATNNTSGVMVGRADA